MSGCVRRILNPPRPRSGAGWHRFDREGAIRPKACSKPRRRGRLSRQCRNRCLKRSLNGSGVSERHGGAIGSQSGQAARPVVHGMETPSEHSWSLKSCSLSRKLRRRAGDEGDSAAWLATKKSERLRGRWLDMHDTPVSFDARRYALPLISAAGRPSLRCPMGVSKHQGPQRRPQIVGFLLQGHPQTGPSICGNQNIRIRSRVPLKPLVPQGSLLRASVDLLTRPLLPNPSPRNQEILSSASVLLISPLQCAPRISSLLTPFLFAQHLCASGLTAQGGTSG